MSSSSPHRKKSSSVGAWSGLVILVGFMGFFGGREVCYSVFGKTAEAKVMGHRNESRSVKGGGLRHVVIVDYSFAEGGGRRRREQDEVPFDLSRTLGETISVEYVPGFSGFSRVPSGRHRNAALMVCGYLGVIALIIGGCWWWYAAKHPQTTPKLEQANPVSLREETESLTMSSAEAVGWCIAGLIGAVLVAISLLGKFDIYGYFFVIPCVVGGYIALFNINMHHRAERQRTRQRTHELRNVAKQLKLDFAPPRLDRFLQSLEKFHLFSIGHHPTLANVMAGQIDGTDVAVFDFTHVIRSGKSTSTVCQTVIWLQRRGTQRTEFALRPESLWNTIGSWLGHGDINFESHPAFSRKYLLRGDDEPAIRELFSDEVLSFFEQQDSGVSLEGSGNKLLYYRAGVRIEPNDLRSLLIETLRLNSMLS